MSMGALMSKRSHAVLTKKWDSIAETVSDVKDWVETSREDAEDIHKRYSYTRRAIGDFNTKLENALRKLSEEYKEVMGECGTLEKISRYCTLKDMCHDVCDVYEEVAAFTGPMPEREAEMSDFEYAMEVVVVFERAKAKKQMKEKSLMNMNEWLKRGKGLLDSAQTMQHRTRERVHYEAMSTMEIIQENKAIQEAILEDVKTSTLLYLVMHRLYVDFVKSKELPPPQRYGELKKMIDRALLSNEWASVSARSVL